LFASQTLSSSRHQAFSFDPKAPNDSLDFLLKAQYNQHADTLKALNKTRVQKDTISEDHGYFINNIILYLFFKTIKSLFLFNLKKDACSKIELEKSKLHRLP
jgi:hypothetical protein